ncbi:Imm52 family immunity protein [Stenotrophomonas sp. Iso1]|uniref:Imm52 family immunity protein n=1 Tax=Stenotrophomonas sp. Iso1 TaxID=2977283 RepID=UPI0022B79B29|nr:Imm52 family immunity protein [Stenotrophomonas sp. Iso1]
MISIIIRFKISEHIKSDFGSAYRQLYMALQRIPGNYEWFCGVNTPKQKQIPFEQEDAVVQRLRERSALMGLQSFSAAVASDDRKSRQPGLIEIDYNPELGYMTVDLYRPDQVLVNPTQWVADIMLAMLESERETTFAFADVYDKVDGEFQYYKSKYATFPHRQCLGWMAYVPQVVTMEQLPLAARIIPAEGGSIIVAVDEPFDLANKAHIKRANQIEMDMCDLGLLAVTDPSF